MTYRYDAVALHRDPNLADFSPDLGSFKTIATSPTGSGIVQALTSRAGVLHLIGAVAAAPSRPAVGAIERLLQDQVGDTAFTDEMKRLTGRVVRHIIEHLGGRWIRSGVPLTISSRYTKGSIYRLEAAQ